MTEIMSAEEMERSLRQRLPGFTLNVWHRNDLEGTQYYEIEYAKDGFYGTFSMLVVFIAHFIGDPSEFAAWRIERDVAKAAEAQS